MKMSIAAWNVVVAGGTAVFIFSIPIQQAENLQRIRSNRGPRLSPTISFVEDNSPAKAGLVEAISWGVYKREKKT
jgi:hypothetical protein